MKILKRVCLLSLLLFAGFYSYGQSKTKHIRGKVYNKISGIALEGVEIYSKNTDSLSLLGQSRSTGMYHVTFNKNNDSLYFRLDGYKTYARYIKRYRRTINAPLLRDSLLETDLPSLKNSIGLLPMKLIWHSVSLHYQYFIKPKFSLGLYADYYYNGRLFSGDEFTGYKFTPVARYFFVRNKSFGFYSQGGVIFGQFDFIKMTYRWDNMSHWEKIDFNSWGFLLSVGVHKKMFKSDNLVFDINMGTQVLPFNGPKTINIGGFDYSAETIWWNFTGPGSVFEIKITIGYMF